MIPSRERRLFLRVALVVLAWSGLWAADAAGFETYASFGAAVGSEADCSLCHPGFLGGPGAPLHDLHLTLTSNCSHCHVTPGDIPKVGLTGNTGCVGCHGRLEDDMGQPLGGLGAGLRLHHKNAGVSFSCEDCHTADPTPVGEQVLPPFFASLGLDPSSDNLDNDGDLLVDASDPDFGGGGNTPPTADPNGPYTGNTGVALTLDGSGSFDADGTIVAYDWDF
ncbi:MAG: hypothetical protein ACC628_04410 [Pirellulaceae bacterium]